MEDFYKEASCPVCLLLIKEVTYLKCGHVMCLSCATTLYNYEKTFKDFSNLINRKSLALMKSSLEILKNRPGIKCPVCTMTTHLDPSEGIAGLQHYKTNDNLQKLVDKLRNIEQEEKCQFCELSKPSVKCRECVISMCQNCSESLHSKGLFKLHTVRKSDDFEIRPQSKRTYKCPVHKQELNIYCKQDGKIVCSHCVVIDSHKSHECVSLEQRCNETRKEILSSAINVKKINAELMESNVLLQNLLESVKKKAKERQLDLDSFEAELIIAVKARFTELRDKVTKIELEKTDCLTKHSDFMLASIEKNKLLLETAKYAQDNNDEFAIVSIGNGLNNEIRASERNKKFNINEPRENEAIDIHVVTDRILNIMSSSWDVYKTENPVVNDITPTENNWFDETTIVIQGRHFGDNDRQKIRVMVGEKECSFVRTIQGGTLIECKVPPGIRGTSGKVVVFVNGQRSKENVLYHWGVNDGMPSWMETTDEYRGLRQSTSHPQVWYAVSRNNVWDKNTIYQAPKGFRWATTEEGYIFFDGSGSNVTSHVYYNQGGWERYTWNGKERYYFRFKDSSITGAAKHAGTTDGSALSINHDVDHFAGIVLIKD